MMTGYQQQRCSRFPEALTLVRLDARSGTRDLFVLGPLVTPEGYQWRGSIHQRRGSIHQRR
eukprot:565676-Prorocentrum_minimum.AAC.1